MSAYPDRDLGYVERTLTAMAYHRSFSIIVPIIILILVSLHLRPDPCPDRRHSSSSNIRSHPPISFFFLLGLPGLAGCFLLMNRIMSC